MKCLFCKEEKFRKYKNNLICCNCHAKVKNTHGIKLWTKNLSIMFMILMFIGLTYALTITEISTPEGTTQNDSVVIEYNISAFDDEGVSSIILSYSNESDFTNISLFSDNLVFGYNFDNRTDLGENDTLINDLSKNSINGSVHGEENVTIVEGKYGNAINFNGNGSYVNTSFYTNLNDTSWTVSLWVKAADIGQAEGADIFSKGYDYRIYLNPSGVIKVLCQNESGGDKSISMNGNLSDLLWHHVVYTYNISENMTYVYFDGSFDGSRELEGINSQDYEFKIGKSQAFDFNGSVDDVYLFNETVNLVGARELYYSSLTKYDYQNWSLNINQSLSFVGGIEKYYLCSSNLSYYETCTSERSLEGDGWNSNIVSNYSSKIGDINSLFYGANTHVDMNKGRYVDADDDGTLESQIDYEWQRDAWLNAKMDNQRGDMYLTSFLSYYLINRGFERWYNLTYLDINYTANTTFSTGFGVSTSGASGYYGQTFELSEDAHSGNYALNVSNNNSEDESSEAFVYWSFTLPAEIHDYNFTGWIKSVNTTTFKGAWNDGADFVCSDTKAGTGDWVFVNCNFTSDGGNTSIRFDATANNYESFLIDDLDLYQDNVLLEYKYYKSLENETELVDWAYDNNQVIYFIADRPSSTIIGSPCKGNPIGYCLGEINYTEAYLPAVRKYIDEVTKNGTHLSAIKIEVTNEPYYYDGWLANIGDDDLEGAIEYVNLYNQTYDYLKHYFPTLDIGGPSGYRNAPNLSNTFISNLSSKFDFISIHPYASNSYIISNQLIVDIDEIFGYCTTHSVDCPQIVLSEWNIAGSEDLKNNSARQNEYGAEVGFSYASILNNYPSNTTLHWYQWSEQYRYNNTASYPEYPDRWTMVTEPQLVIDDDPAFKSPYNVTKSFAHLCPAGGQVYESLSDDSTIKVVSCKDGNQYSNIIINTGEESRNINLDGTTATAIAYMMDTNTGALYLTNNSNQLGIMDSYDIKYLGTPNFTLTIANNLTKTAKTGEEYVSNEIYINNITEITGLSASRTYHIASLLSIETPATTILNVDCSKVSSVTITPKGKSAYVGTYTCSGNTLTISNTNYTYSTSSNVIVVGYTGVQVTSCNSAVSAFASYVALLGLIGMILFFGWIVSYLFGFVDKESFRKVNMVAGITTLILVGILIIIAIFILSTICSVF